MSHDQYLIWYFELLLVEVGACAPKHVAVAMLWMC